MFCHIISATIVGTQAQTIEVQVDFSQGFPSFTIVGLPDTAIQEARERIRSAIKHSGFSFPNGRIIVNLAPADIPKSGPSFDLPIALGILATQNIFSEDTSLPACLGELTLDGRIRPVPGVLPSVVTLQTNGQTTVIVPELNGSEAALVAGITVYAAPTLSAVVAHCQRKTTLKQISHHQPTAALPDDTYDFTAIRGQAMAKQALEIVAAGGHHALLYGPPGAGKTALAKSIQSILPPLSSEEMIAVTKLYSIAHCLPPGAMYVSQRPFRQPHHSASLAAVVGGGTMPRPGEISLAHHGVLFFDELPEFSRSVLEALRQPLEDEQITVARVRQSVVYPVQTRFIAAMNPCPCGFYGDHEKVCTCSAMHIKQYQKKLSGPLLDRLDLFCYMTRPTQEQLVQAQPIESLTTIRQRITQALQRQQQRLQATPFRLNGRIPSKYVLSLCQVETPALQLVQRASQQLHLSPRAFYRLIRVARTIADLADHKPVTISDMQIALQYRQSLLT